jgi:cytochrome b involved in lipid metabolism
MTLQIQGHRYDVTNFRHPGEKPTKGISITNYYGQDATARFLACHAKPGRKEAAESLLAKARSQGEYEGIKYVGPVDS